jgi:hypothetical protein
LVVIDSLCADIMAHSSWYRNQTPEQRNLYLLEKMAEKMGYSILKKNTESAKNVENKTEFNSYIKV